MAEKKPFPVEIRIEQVRREIGRIVSESGLSISILAMILREAAQKATDQERFHLNHLARQMQEEGADDGLDDGGETGSE